jgi:hypothetical protein
VSKDKMPDGIRPFEHHGLRMEPTGSDGQWVGDCPFCDREGKLFVSQDTTLWDCKVCGQEGNLQNFLTKLCARPASSSRKGSDGTARMVAG